MPYNLTRLYIIVTTFSSFIISFKGMLFIEKRTFLIKSPALTISQFYVIVSKFILRFYLASPYIDLLSSFYLKTVMYFKH